MTPLQTVRLHIDQVEARQRAAEAPYKAQEAEIEAAIERLKHKLAATYEARCEIARPFEIELDVLYEEELRLERNTDEELFEEGVS